MDDDEKLARLVSSTKSKSRCFHTFGKLWPYFWQEEHPCSSLRLLCGSAGSDH